MTGRRNRAVGLWALTALAVPATAQEWSGQSGTDVYVAPWGVDDAGCGTVGRPCLTIRRGLQHATFGDTVLVHAGTYSESWLQMKSGVRLVSVDGPLRAKIHSGDQSAVRLTGVYEASIDGFEVYGDLNQGPPGDGLVRVDDARDITIRSSMLHDAPTDCDVVKVTDTDKLVIDRCVVFNPARRVGRVYCDPAYQENVDLYGQLGPEPRVRGVVLRDSWLFHTATGGDWLVYAKRNTEDVVYEGNVFGPSAGGSLACGGNPAVGIGTNEDSAGLFHVRHAIVRNNLFVGLQGDAALGVQNSDDVWIYNNTFVANGGLRLQSVIMFRGNQIPVGEVHLLNNVFAHNRPDASGARFLWVRDLAPATFEHAFNLYVNNVVASDLSYLNEVRSLYGVDPVFASPAMPSTSAPSLARIAEIKRRYMLLGSSRAIDRGIDVVAEPGHPAWDPRVTEVREDAFGAVRPSRDTWDLGLHERHP